MLEPVLENGGAGKEGSYGQHPLTTTPSPLRSSSASTGQPSLSRNPHNLPRALQSPRAVRFTELPSPKRLTPETMLTHLHTIQDEEQKRLSRRRESSTAVDISSTLHLPPPSPITSAPSSQSPTGGGQPHDGDNYDDEDDEHTLPTPYASCTPHQLSVATSRLHDIAQQFQDVVAGLQDAIARRQSTTTTPPRPELLSLQERLARVHSVAITEHEIVVREVKARRGGAGGGGGGGRRAEEASKRSGGYY
ncbi:hypothetical protein GCG54_00002654 [Colletotrichum gloeosporioides]|uniref:Uncharacterized protein n=1 Tax=Colletotrichum gloeosporioides TaxID=474922 RepID=A0A8H4FPZ9_COLGL|nr:uncharacterized protein GCG54_00002654 [Colletotrichum gloeosporioides]KAF3810200.1 hypothetical protein GCG54_00002654 [Colletotrichum gloeosporioides]